MDERTMRSQIVQLGQEVLDGLQVQDATTRAVHALLRDKMNDVSLENYPAIMLIHEILPYVELAGEIQPSTMRALARRSRALYTAVIQDARGWAGGADQELDRETAAARRAMATMADEYTRQGSRVSATPDAGRRMYEYILQFKELAREVSLRIDVPPRTDPRVQALATMLMSLYQNRDIPSSAFTQFASAVAVHIFLVAEHNPTEARTAEYAMDLYKAFLRAQGLSDAAIDQTIMDDIRTIRRDLDEELARHTQRGMGNTDADIAMRQAPYIQALKQLIVDVYAAMDWTQDPRAWRVAIQLMELGRAVPIPPTMYQPYASDVAMYAHLAASLSPGLEAYSERALELYKGVLRARRLSEDTVNGLVREWESILPTGSVHV